MVSSQRKRSATRAISRAGQSRAQVLLPQRLDRISVELEFLGDLFDGGLATAPPHLVGRALGMEEFVRMPRQNLQGRGLSPSRTTPYSVNHVVKGEPT